MVRFVLIITKKKDHYPVIVFLAFLFNDFKIINYRFFLSRHHQNDLHLRYALFRQDHQRQ